MKRLRIEREGLPGSTGQELLGGVKKSRIEQEGLTNRTGLELLDGVRKSRIDREGLNKYRSRTPGWSGKVNK